MISTIQDFFASLQAEDSCSALKKLIIYHCAPVNRGLKPAEVITLSGPSRFAAWQRHGRPIAQELGLRSLELIRTQSRVTVLFYHPQRLKAVLAEPDVRALLADLGYHKEHPLSQLKKRFSPQKCPDEIGLFLGYPVEDVRGFIRNKGRFYKASGYWKVYGDLASRLELFQAIKRTKQQTAQALLSGEL